MTRKDLISIIIPVYNVKPYLESCVKSVLRQTYEKIEIILVDDGSTDGSSAICDKIKKIDNRIQVYHKENGGLSDARNYGVEKSKGKYVMFIDSDDLVEESIVTYLHNNIVFYDSDISVCDYVRFVDEKKVNYLINGHSEIIESQMALKLFLYQKRISTSACAKLYKSDILKKNKFIKGQRFEDNDFLYRVISCSESISYGNMALYGYRIRKSSITTSTFSDSDFDIIAIGENILESCKSECEEIKNAARAYQCSNCIRILLTVTNEYYHDKRCRYCEEFIDKNYKKVLKDREIRNELRVFLILYKLGLSWRILSIIRNNKKKWVY